MSSNSRRSLLGMAAVMGLGLLAMGSQPAAAAPRDDYRSRNDTRYSDYYRRSNDYFDDALGGRYNGRNNRRHSNRRVTRYDIDGDGVRNDRDRDLDGDGIRNERDRDIDGDGISNSRDRYDTSPSGWYSGSNGNHGRNRNHRRDTDGDGVRNRRDRDIDGDGRWNWRDRDKDGDNRRNSRDRNDRNPYRR